MISFSEYAEIVLLDDGLLRSISGGDVYVLMGLHSGLPLLPNVVDATVPLPGVKARANIACDHYAPVVSPNTYNLACGPGQPGINPVCYNNLACGPV